MSSPISSIVSRRACTRTTGSSAGALSIATDEHSGDVVPVNRTAVAVTVVDPRKGVVEENVATGADPDHVEITDGTAYVVDKSGATRSEDTLTRIRLAR